MGIRFTPAARAFAILGASVVSGFGLVRIGHAALGNHRQGIRRTILRVFLDFVWKTLSVALASQE